MIEKIIEKWKGKPIRDVLVELYIEKDMNMRDVANELGISLGSVHHLLNKYDVVKIIIVKRKENENE